MATAPLKSAAGAPGTVRMLADGICRPQVVILTERPESVVEHRRDEAVVLFEERGAVNSTAVPLITLPESDVAPANPALRLCSCPEWHALRLLGRGRGRVSFETCHEDLADVTISGACQVCGYGLRA